MGGRLGIIFSQEFRHTLRRPLFWTLVTILGLTAYGLSSGSLTILSGDSQVGGTKAFITSQFAVSQMLAFMILLIYAFFAAVAFGMSVISDEDLKISPLLHATPLRPSEYVWGKFLALMAAFAAALLMHLALAALFNHLVPSAEHAEIHGPFEIGNYVVPAAIFGLPTLLFLAGAAFAIGSWTRRPILVFVFPVLLVVLCGFFLWSWSPSWLDPRVNQLLMLLDPTGFRWLNETWLRVDRGVAFYNHQPVGYDLLFLGNRVAVAAIGLLAVAAARARLARDLRGAASPAARRAAESLAAAGPQPAAAASPAAGVAGAVDMASLGQSGRPAGFLAGAMHVLRAESAELWSQPGLYIFVPLILLQTTGQTLIATGAFDTPLLMTTGLMASRAMNTLTLLVCLLILFYMVESLDRERRCGMLGIFNATPLRTGSILLGKALANSAVGVVVMAAMLLACMIALLIQGRVPFDLRPFFLLWGLLLLPTFLAWSAFVALVQGVTGNRYFTYGAGLAVLIFTGFRQAFNKMNWVGNWDLWNVVRWSDISFLELDRAPLLWNRLWVLSLAALCTVLAVKLYTRRMPDAISLPARLRPLAVLRGALRLWPWIAACLFTGAYLFVLVFSGRGGPVAEKRAKDYWRKNLATWRDAPLPSIAAADLDVDLYPERSGFSMNGSYVLKNRHTAPLDRFPLTVGDHCDSVHWTLAGRKYVPENRINLFVFTPPGPLQPGDSVRIGFQYQGTFPKGASKNGGNQQEFILPSSVVLTAFEPSFAPVVGYIEERGVTRENKYEPRDYPDSFFTGVTPPAYGYDPFPVRIRVSAPRDMTINCVGERIADTPRGSRHTVEWRSDQPVSLFNIVAGRWKVRAGQGTEIYYDARHAYNIDEMAEALDAARRYYSEWFHPFPWKTLKLSEFAGLADYAQGFPTNITFSENIGFLTRSDPRANAAFLVTAHESAHQWWGNMLLPGKGPGGNILSEGMAHFSTILLFGQVKGDRQRIEVCKRLETSYNRRRRADSERPLVKIDGSRDGDETVTYDKGGWVFWMLLNHMGRERDLRGLRGFMNRYYGNPDHPVLQDFTAFMRDYAADTAAYNHFVNQWFYDVVVPEYHLESANRTGAGDSWDVSVKVTNIGTGSMPLEVAATRGDRFLGEKLGWKAPSSLTPRQASAAADAPDPGYRDARAGITLGKGESRTVTIHCGFKPERVLVDPDAMVLMLNRKNAVAKL